MLVSNPAAGDHDGQALPPAPAATPPVAESRGRVPERWGNEGADHQDLTPDYLHPPSPEKNAPRADDPGSARKGAPRQLRSRRGGLGDARLGISAVDPPRPRPPTPPPQLRPRTRGVAAAERSGPLQQLRSRKRSLGNAQQPRHGQDLPPAPAARHPSPVAETRARAAQVEGADHHHASRPRPPAPSIAGKNAPRGRGLAQRSEGTCPAAPELVSAILIGGR